MNQKKFKKAVETAETKVVRGALFFQFLLVTVECWDDCDDHELRIDGSLSCHSCEKRASLTMS